MENNGQLLKEIARNVDDIKKRLINIELNMKEVDMDMHEIRPEYIQKLKKIEEQEGTRFKDIKELRRIIESDA